MIVLAALPFLTSSRRWTLSLLFVFVAVALAPGTAGTHTVTEKSCTLDHDLTLVASDTCAPGSITCPASHGICPFSIKATITGTGIVAATVFQDAKACGPALNTCTVQHLYNVSPGLPSAPTCRMSLQTTALDVHMVCTLRG